MQARVLGADDDVSLKTSFKHAIYCKLSAYENNRNQKALGTALLH